MTAVARTVTCAGCGGKVALTARTFVDGGFTCLYCGLRQTLSEEQRAELADYEVDVAAALAKAEQERARTAQWDVWYGGRGGRSPNANRVAFMIFGTMFALVFALSIVAQALMTSGNSALMPIANLMMPIAVPVLFVTAIVVHGVWYYGGRQARRAGEVPPRTQAKCPRCGATSELAAGRVVERCTHCGASLLPTTTMMAGARAAVNAAQLRAELERYRTERRGLLQATSSSMGAVIPYVVIGSFLPMTLGIAVVFTVDAIVQGRAEPGLAALWVLAAINATLLLLVWTWRRDRRERYRVLLAHAVAPFVHHDVADVRGVGAWLDRHWADSVEHAVLGAGPYFASSAFTVGEYAGLVVLNPIGLGRGWDGHVSLFVAAWTEATPAVDPALHVELRKLGFHLQVSRAGLRASGDEATAKRLAKLPNGGALVAHVVTELVTAARAVGAPPVRLEPDEA